MAGCYPGRLAFSILLKLRSPAYLRKANEDFTPDYNLKEKLIRQPLFDLLCSSTHNGSNSLSL